MGGAGFPTQVKIQPNEKMPKTVLIINGCECEPFITCDYRMMLEWTYQMIAGIKLTNRVTECPEVYIGTEDNKPRAIKAVRKLNREKLCSTYIRTFINDHEHLH